MLPAPARPGVSSPIRSLGLVLLMSAVACVASPQVPDRASVPEPEPATRIEAPASAAFEVLERRALLLTAGMIVTLEDENQARAWRLETLASLPGTSAVVACRGDVSAAELAALVDDGRIVEALLETLRARDAALAIVDDQGRLGGCFELEWPAADAPQERVLIRQAGDPGVGSEDDESPGAVVAAHIVRNIVLGRTYHPGTCFEHAKLAGRAFVASREVIARVAATPGVTRILFTWMRDGGSRGPWYAPPSVHAGNLLIPISGAGQRVPLHARVYTGYWNEVGWFPAGAGDAWEPSAGWLLVHVR